MSALFNDAVISAADTVARAVWRDFFAIRGQGAVALAAIAGAGKSHFVMDTVKKCRRRDMRVAVAAATNEQAFSLVSSIARNEPARPVAFIPAGEVELPAWARHSNVRVISPAHRASREPVVVGTIDRFGAARNPRHFSIPQIERFDALIMDESFQANAGRYFAMADIADRHLTVGDRGQIPPFTTVEAGMQWRGLPEDPLQTAVDVLRTNHPDTPLHQFPITRRLDGRGAKIVKCFYPAGHTFGAAVADGVRQMKLSRAIASSPRMRSIDERACPRLEARMDISGAAGAPDTHLRSRDGPVARRSGCSSSREDAQADLRAQSQLGLDSGRIAIGVSHNDQKAAVRNLLDQAGLRDVVVDTANKLQGREFDLVVGWHPMAGLDEADEFHLQSGRMCVLCTRHRHACIVVGRAEDRKLVEGLPPSTPTWPGAETDDILRGWEVHRAVFAALECYRVRAD